MSKNYAWKEGAPKPPVDANVFGRTLENIEAEAGSIDPRVVVQMARDPSSPLHPAFEWDQERAAEEYRVQQARKWIGALTVVRVTIEQRAQPQRQFFSVRTDDAGKRGYMDRDKIMGSSDLKRQLIERARDDLLAYVARYSSILTGTLAGERIKEATDLIKDEAEALGFDATRRTGRQATAKTVDEDTRSQA